MNRQERRRFMRKVPGYKKTVHAAAHEAVSKFEKMMQEKWKEGENKDGQSDGKDETYEN